MLPDDYNKVNGAGWDVRDDDGFRCQILADTRNPVGNRLTTFCVTYPRFIHAEILTHRDKSRNSASSRAIPVSRMLRNIEENPVVPIHWGANQKGMQAFDVLSPEDQEKAKALWLSARDSAVSHARQLLELGLHKQIANRITEPWMWITVILSGTNWNHMFKLRCHEAAEPHFQRLSGMMRTAYDENKPVDLVAGEWHLPLLQPGADGELSCEDRVRVCTARCARVSYLTHEGTRDVEKDMELHDSLSTNGHWSPFEHVAKALKVPKRIGNFVGYEQYRKSFQNEYVTSQEEVSVTSM